MYRGGNTPYWCVYTVAHSLLAQLYTMVQTIGGPTDSKSKRKEKKRGRERERGKIIEQKKSKHLDPTYRVGYNALINEGHQDRHAVPAKNLIWANTV